MEEGLEGSQGSGGEDKLEVTFTKPSTEDANWVLV